MATCVCCPRPIRRSLWPCTANQLRPSEFGAVSLVAHSLLTLSFLLHSHCPVPPPITSRNRGMVPSTSNNAPLPPTHHRCSCCTEEATLLDYIAKHAKRVNATSEWSSFDAAAGPFSSVCRVVVFVLVSPSTLCLCVLCTVYCVMCTMYCALCTVYCVLCTVYCVLCTVHCALCTVYCVLCTVYCVPCTGYRVLCTVYCVLCTVYCVLCTVYCVLCTVYYCAVCTVYCVLCSVYCVLCTVYCVLCAVCCVLCTVYCVLCTVCCVLCAVYCVSCSDVLNSCSIPNSHVHTITCTHA
jgi:hypothetical protein